MMFGAEAIGARLQRLRIGDPKKGIVVSAKANALALEFPGDEGMAVDPVAGPEGQKRADAQDHGTENFIANVEVVVGITRPFPLDYVVMGIFGRVLGPAGTEGGTRFHDFEDEIDAEAFRRSMLRA